MPIANFAPTIRAMPLIRTETYPGNTTTNVWSITESIEFFRSHLELSDADRDFLDSTHPVRAIEWAASRKLLRKMTGYPTPFACFSDRYGKPYLPNDPRQISISHSGGHAAVALSDVEVGIDLQIPTPKLNRIAPKFISEDEFEVVNSSDSDRKIQLCWSAKEAMFKLYSRGQVDFRKHLQVDLPQEIRQSGIIDGLIKKGVQHTKCNLHYVFIQELLLVTALEK